VGGADFISVAARPEHSVPLARLRSLGSWHFGRDKGLGVEDMIEITRGTSRLRGSALSTVALCTTGGGAEKSGDVARERKAFENGGEKLFPVCVCHDQNSSVIKVYLSAFNF